MVSFAFGQTQTHADTHKVKCLFSAYGPFVRQSSVGGGTCGMGLLQFIGIVVLCIIYVLYTKHKKRV